MKAPNLGFIRYLLAVALIWSGLSSLAPYSSALDSSALAEDFSSSVTSRISEALDSFTESNGASGNPHVSKNGRFVVFESTATNLVPDGAGNQGSSSNIDWDNTDNSRRRIYLYDRQSNTVELVSVTSLTGNTPYTDIKADCYNPVVSNDGRYVAFTVAYNPSVHVSDNVNVCRDEACHVNIAHEGQHIYVRDRIANDTMLISQVTAKIRRQVVTNGVPQTETDDPAVCGKIPTMETVPARIAARVIADCTDNPPYDNSTNRCSSMPGTFSVAHSDHARISADGRYIVYDSDSNSLSFVQEITNARPGPAAGIESDPGYRFCCANLDPAHCLTGGNHSGWVNNLWQVGTSANFYFEWSIFTSAYDDATYGEWYKDDGSKDRKIRDIYLRDGADYKTTMVSNFCKYHEPGAQCDIEAVEDAIKPSISDDGSLISFQTKTPFLDLDFNEGYQGGNINLPNHGDDVFVVERSLITGEIGFISRVSNNTSRIRAGNGDSSNALLSADGRYVVFQSNASNLVLGDSNSLEDIFLFDRTFNRTLLCSKLADGTQLNAASEEPSVSGSGEYVSFDSAATNTSYSGAFGQISQAYVAKVSKNADGTIKDCSLELASAGSGTGANASAFGAGIAVVPQTVTSGSTTSRIQRSSVVYESSATNLDSTVTDTNSVSDIFQAPICNDTDLNTDTDGDGTTDCFDQCYNDPIKVEDGDTDSDGYANCEDACPTDPQKKGPQTCGCGVPEIDSDGDDVYDCKDLCPNDATKISPGACGCGIADLDDNHNGTADCNDSTLPTPVATSTPVQTATPLPTATPDLASVFTRLTPIKPSMSKGRAKGTLVLSVNTSNVPSGIDVTGFKTQFTCKKGSVTKNYSKNNILGGTIKGFLTGYNCKVKVNLRGTFAGRSLISLQSASSSGVTVK